MTVNKFTNSPTQLETIQKINEIIDNLGNGANTDINNLTSLGNARLQYAPFAINAGSVDSDGENNTLTYSGAVITCSSCIITTCNSRTFIDTSSKSLDVSGGSTIVELPWTQPALTSDGTLGGDTCACSATGGYYSSRYIYYAFDGSTSNYWQSGYNNGVTDYLTFYTPDPIKVQSIVWTTASYAGGSVLVAGSNDNSTWTTLGSVSVPSANTNYTISCNSNEFFKYFRFTNTPTSWKAQCAEVTFTATYQKTVSGAEGNHSIFKSATNGALVLVDNFYIGKTAPSTPSDDDFWLDTSIVPANLKSCLDNTWSINNDLVYIGDCTVSSGAVSAISNRLFNDSGYLVEKNYNAEFSAFCPDISLAITKSNSGFTADENGWLKVHGMVKPVSGGAQGVSEITVNGEAFTVAYTGGTSGNTVGGVLMIPLDKGDVVAVSAAGYSIELVFFPLKGIK